MLLDHSKFDSTVTVEHLRLIHRVYMRAFKSAELARLLRCQINNKCRTMGGIRYNVKGTRMSGDFDTALGNTLLNYIVIKDVMEKSGVKFRLLVDGDDSVVVLERSDVEKVQLNIFAEWGFETKCAVVNEIHKVEYCQHWYVDAPVPFFSRHPAKVISSYAMTLINYMGRGFEKHFRGCMMGEAHISKGVPIIGPLCEEQAHGPFILDPDSRYRLTRPKVSVDTEASRMAFCETFGISPDQQEEYERIPLTLIASHYNGRNNRAHADPHSDPRGVTSELAFHRGYSLKRWLGEVLEGA